MIGYVTLASLAGIASILGTGLAFGLLGKAHRNSRIIVNAHLDVIRSWVRGPEGDGQGWRANQITLLHRLEWLNPSHVIFPLASGPGLIQMTAGDKLTLGGDLVRAIVMLNQNITSFNATLGKVESFRVAHAAALSRVHVEATRRLMAAPEVLGPSLASVPGGHGEMDRLVAEKAGQGLRVVLFARRQGATTPLCLRSRRWLQNRRWMRTTCISLRR